MAQTLWGSDDISKLARHYIDKGGQVWTIDEGVLGWGTVVMFGEGLRNAVIQEKYINCWSSGHTIRFYQRMPKKYRKILEEEGYAL